MRIVRSHPTFEDDPESGGRYSLPIAKYNGLQERSEGLAGAVQSRLDGSRVDAQMVGRLFGVKFLEVAQDENLSVRIGQSVDAGPNVGAGLGPGEPRQRLVLPDLDRVTVVPALVEGREQVVDPDLPAPRPGPQSHEADVDHNAVQPGSQSRVPLEALQGTERREEGVLHGIGAVLLGPEESTGHDEHAPAVLADQRLAGTLVASPDACEQLDVVRGTPVPVVGAEGLQRAARRVLAGIRHRRSPCKSSATNPE